MNTIHPKHGLFMSPTVLVPTFSFDFGFSTGRVYLAHVSFEKDQF